MFEHFNSILPIFFSLLLTCAVLIILVPNPIHSVLLLILLFCNSAILLLLFNIEFLSLMLIIIYVGAVTILFLFVIMMLDIQITSKNKNDLYNYIFFSIFIIISFFVETFISTIDLLNQNIINNSLLNYTLWVSFIDNITNIETIGQILYTFYFFYFLVAGLILLIALIGAVVLTSTRSSKRLIDTTTFKQVSRLKNNAVFNIT